MILGVSLPVLPLSYLTIVLLVFVLVGFLSGLVKGFGIEFLGLLKMAGVIFGSAFLVGVVQPLIADKISFISDPNTQDVVIYAVLFIVLWIVLALIVGLIKRLFLRQLPGGWSKFFGGIIGAVKAAFIAIVVSYIVVKLANAFDTSELLASIVNTGEDPVGKFLVDNNLIDKVVEAVKSIIAK